MAILARCPFCHRKQSVRSKTCISCGQDLVKAKKANKVKFWVSYRLPGGKQKSEAVGYSIEEARDAEGKRRSQKRENRIFDIKPDAKMTFQDLANWYLGLKTVKALASYLTEKIYLTKFCTEFGDWIVREIKAANLEDLQAERKAQGKAAATVDHEIGVARRVIIKAFDNEKVGGDTLRAFKKVKKLLKKHNANARDRVITPAEFRKLLDSEKLPRHTRSILAMGYYTGMRLREILTLIWPKVDMKDRVIRLDAEDTKDEEAREIPIFDELYDILRGIPRALHNDHVFLYRGKPVKDIRTGLKKACTGAGITYGRFARDGFIFHDLRHTYVTYMRKAGVHESVIMRITGHSSREMFDRYNKVDTDDLKAAMVLLRAFLKSVDQNVDQKQSREDS